MFALIATAVVILGTGNVYAYTWLGADWSVMSSSGAYWSSECYLTPDPTVSSGSSLTWQNTFENERSGYSYYPAITWRCDNNANQGGITPRFTISYRGTWAPDGQINAETSSGNHYISISHLWKTGVDGPIASQVYTSHNYII
jgi:hypothetical protein